MIEFADIQKELDYYKKFVPVNYQEEKKTFFSRLKQNKVYNPVFNYNDAYTIKDYQHIRQFLINSRGRDKIIDCFLDIYIQIADMMMAWKKEDYQVITDLSGTLFGSYRTLNTRYAISQYKMLMANTALEPEKLFTDNQIGCIFLEEFSKMGLSGWSIEYPIDNGSEISIYELEKKVVIKKGTRATQSGIERIICHEIFGHAFQAFNALNENHCRTNWLTTYLGTELQYEGWAIFTEINNLQKKHIQAIFRRYILLMIATDLASELSFADLYTHLFDISKDNEFSFFAAAKAKRGFRNTVHKGCFQKENSYLLGAIKIIGLVKNDHKNIKKLSRGVFPFSALGLIDTTKKITWVSIESLNMENIIFFSQTANKLIKM